MEELAAEPESLTETALDALTEEVRISGLYVARTDDRIDPDSGELSEELNETRKLSELISLYEYGDIGKAVIAKGVLEPSGIGCHLYDNKNIPIGDKDMNVSSIPRMGAFYRPIESVDLRVHADDVEAAKGIPHRTMEEPLDDDEGDVGSWSGLRISPFLNF